MGCLTHGCNVQHAGLGGAPVQKAEKKGRTKSELDEIICWLTDYTPQAVAGQVKERKDRGPPGYWLQGWVLGLAYSLLLTGTGDWGLGTFGTMICSLPAMSTRGAA